MTTFWISQVLVWLSLGSALFVPAWRIAELAGVSKPAVVVRICFTAFTGFVLSSVLGWFYGRFLSPFSTGRRVIGAGLLVCCIFSLLWVGIEHCMMHSAMYALLLRPEAQQASHVALLIQFVRSFLLLGLWSATYLMLRSTRRLRKASFAAIEAAGRATEARIQLLRAQLNPHFLFNALNNVVGLIGADPVRAQSMIRDLSGLLRWNLAERDELDHTIGIELEFIRLYLNCEQVRFGDRLHVEVTVPEEVRAQPIPSMTLQPLVENAIKHGFGPDLRLSIRIEGAVHGDEVQLRVMNRGRVQPQEEGTLGGMGLRNVGSRLAMMFPDSGQVRLYEEGGWVVAFVCYRPRTRLGGWV